MKRSWISFPYLVWMGIFVAVPLLLVIYYSFTAMSSRGMEFSLAGYQKFFEPVYIKVLFRSVMLALISTVCCLVIGYPLAMILAGKDLSSKNFLILLFVLPMWMNFLLRTYAWMTLLERKGLINTFFSFLHLPTIQMLYTNEAVILGMIYNFLPFMVLPIYSVLKKMDHHVIEAAKDLGANDITVFWRIVFPLSLPVWFPESPWCLCRRCPPLSSPGFWEAANLP